MRYHYSGIEITDPTIKSSTSNDGAFISLLEAETKGVATDLKKDINRQVFGTGDGLLASVVATSTTTTTLAVDSVQYIRVGDVVDVLRRTDGADVPTTTDGVGKTVASKVGGQTKTITFSATVGGAIATTYGIYLTGSRNNEMDGLRNISATTTRTLHSISSATYPIWDPQLSTASNAVAGESLFEQLADNVGATGNAEVEVFLTTRGIRRRLADTYQSQKRFNDAKAVEVHGGYSAIMVNEVPVVADDDAPVIAQSGTLTQSVGWAFAINKGAFKWFELDSPGWMEPPQGGSIFTLKDGSTAGTKVASYQAFFDWYAALGCVAPNRTGAIAAAAADNPGSTDT
jgi:hypothetical protein